MYRQDKLQPVEDNYDIKDLSKEHASVARAYAVKYDALTLRYAVAIVRKRNEHIHGVELVCNIFLCAAGLVEFDEKARLAEENRSAKANSNKKTTRRKSSKPAYARNQALKKAHTVAFLHMSFCFCDLCELFSISNEEFDQRYPHLVEDKRFEEIDYVMTDLHYRYPNK